MKDLVRERQPDSQNLMTTPRIAFIHIPKTGGSQLVGKVINLWPKEEVSPHTSVGGFMTDPDCHRYHFTAGHVFYLIVKKLFHPDTEWMTMLREPVERTYSHYNHLVKFNLTDIDTFQDFVHNSQDSQMGRNLMARHLAWWPKNYHGVPSYSGEIERIPLDIPEDELYDRAMEILDTFWHVGIQESGWVQAVEAIYGKFGLPLPAGVIQEPSKNYRAIINEHLLADIEEFNQVDMRIYKEYKERGNEKVSF